MKINVNTRNSGIEDLKSNSYSLYVYVYDVENACGDTHNKFYCSLLTDMSPMKGKAPSFHASAHRLNVIVK